MATLFIDCVEAQYTAEYIANVFWNQNIAQVRKITIIPHLIGDVKFQSVYIEIETWCDSEVAYNFIQRVKNPVKEARLVHRGEDWWNIEENTQSFSFASMVLGTYTTTSFTNKYFVNEELEKELENQIVMELAFKNVTLRPQQRAYVF